MTDLERFHPLKGKVLVRPDKPLPKPKNGILLPDWNEPEHLTGKVVALPREEKTR